MDDVAPRRRRRWGRALLLAGATLVGATGVTALVGWAWLSSDAGNRWLLARLGPVLQGVVAEGTVSVGGLDTDFVRRLEVTDVRVVDADGHEVLGIDRLAARFTPWGLLVGDPLVVHEIAVSGLVLDVVTDAEGRTSLARLFPSDPDAPQTPWAGLPIDVVAHRVGIDGGRLSWATASRTWALSDLRVEAAASVVGPRVAVWGLEVGGTATEPDEGPIVVGARALAWDGDRASVGGLHAEALGAALRASGAATGLTGDPTLGFGARLLPLDLSRVDAFLGAPGLGGRWAGTAWATGPLAALVAHADLRGVDGAVGRLHVDATADLAADDLPWSATILASDLHAHHAYVPLATMVPALGDEVVVDGVIEASGSGTSWPDGLAVTADWRGGPQRVFGMDFDGVDAELGLAGGVLTIASLSTTGPMGALDGAGTIDLAKGPLDLRLEGPFVPAELSRFGAEGFDGRGWLRARFTGDPRAAAPVYLVGGRLVVDDLGYGPEIAVSHAEGQVGVRIDGGGVRVTADLDGAAGEAYGVAFQGVDEPHLVVDYRYTGDLSVSGDGTVRDAALPGLFAAATTAGPWAYTRPRGTGGVFETRVVLGAFSIVDTLHGDRGTADVRFEGERVDYAATLWDGARVVVDTQGTYATPDASVALERLLVSPAEGYAYDAVRPVRLRLVDGGIADADVALAGRSGERVVVRGRLGTRGPLDARVEVEALDLGLIAAMFPESAGDLSGTATLTADLGGTADSATAQGDLAFAGRVVADQVEPLYVAGTFDGAADRLAIDLVSRVSDRGLLDVRGAVPVRLDLGDPGLDPGGEVDLVAVLRPGGLDRLRGFAPSIPEGAASARLEARGPIADPRLRLDALVETPVEGWAAPARVELGLDRAQGRVEAWADVFEGTSRRGTLDGLAADEVAAWAAWALGSGERPPADGYSAFVPSLRLDAHLLGVPVASLLALTGQELEAEGRVAGEVTVTGSPDTPVVRADVDWIGGRLGDVAIEHGEIRVDPVDEGYTLEALLRTADGSLFLGGDVPVYVDLRKDPRAWATGDLALALRAERLPLAAVSAFVPDVTDASGFLAMTGSVVGPVHDPRPSIQLAIEDGSLAYHPLGVRYDRIHLDATGTRDAVEVTSLTLDSTPLRGGAGLSRGTLVGGGQAGQGPDLSLSGRIGVVGWLPTEVSAKVEVAEFFAMALPENLVVVAGRSSVAGTWPDLAVRGNLEVQSGYWKLDAASFLEQGPLALDPRVVVHRGGQSWTPRGEPEQTPAWHAFDVQVAVAITRNLEVEVLFPFLTSYGGLGAALTTADVDARLAGDVDFSMREGEFDLRGEVEVVEGAVSVLRSNFDLQEGRLTFQGDPSDPFLDLGARMDVGSGSYVEMAVRGPTREPEVAFSSPDYPSDSQILAILITGQPPDTLAPEQGPAMARTMLNLLLTSVLGGARIGTVTMDADGTVRVGLPLGKVYAEAVYRLGADTDENTIALDYEIQLGRKLLLDGTVGDRETFLDLLWEIRF